MKSSPNNVVTAITNAASDRVLTVGTVTDEQQDLNSEANLTFDGTTLTVAGNLTVTGTTTSLSTTNTLVKDKLIELGNGVSGTPSGDAGIIIERGSSTNAGIVWDESGDVWSVCTTSATGASTGDLTLTDAALKSAAITSSGVVTATGFTIGNAVITEAELEVLDGATLSTTELNYVDGVTSAIQTQLDGKQPVDADLTALSSCQSGGAAALALLTSTEVAILDGATLSTAELNYVDGVTSAVQTQLDGKSPVAGHSSIATVGTIGTGTWQGTKVASAYLDDDTAHLSGSQTFTGTKTLNSFKGTAGATVTNILDEDAMGSNSATALATQQSIKAYADTKSPVAGHSSIATVGTIGTGTWQGTAVASAYLDADTAHLSGTQTFTGTKTLNSFKGTGGATVTNILDEDAMGSDSATALATQQSIKAYADTKSPVAGHSSIATVGTIGTGTWQGTAVASAYLDADTAHLTTTQTFTGAKTFTGGVTIDEGELTLGSTAVSSTAAELNLLDAMPRGNLIIGNASAASARLAPGNADQVLTTDGTDVVWTDPAGGAAADDSNTIFHMQVFA